MSTDGVVDEVGDADLLDVRERFDSQTDDKHIAKHGPWPSKRPNGA